MSELTSTLLFERNAKAKEAREAKQKRFKEDEEEKAKPGYTAKLSSQIQDYIERASQREDFDISELNVYYRLKSDMLPQHSPGSMKPTNNARDMVIEGMMLSSSNSLNVIASALMDATGTIVSRDPKDATHKLFWVFRGTSLCGFECKCVYRRYGFELHETDASDSSDSAGKPDSPESESSSDEPDPLRKAFDPHAPWYGPKKE
jgi:hypothetical protein